MHTVGSMALLICVLIGGLSSISWDLTVLKVPSGGDAAMPEYRIGLSGICVAIGGETIRCWSKFPYLFNQKISEGGFVAIGPDEYKVPGSQRLSPVHELAIALPSLLIASIFLGAISIGICLTRKSGFDKLILWAAGPDLLLLAGCGTMLYFIVFS